MTDGFSASFRIFEAAGNRAISITARLDDSITNLMSQNAAMTVNAIGQVGSEVSRTNQLITQANESAAKFNKNLTHALGKSAGATIGSIRQIGVQLEQQHQTLLKIIEDQKRHKEKTDDTERSASKLLGTLSKIAAATGATALVKSFLNTSDALTQTNARLNMMNDGAQSTAELNEMIYQSAQRSRAAYDSTADAIAQMGLNAGNAFNSNQELIAFMESVNKQFAIGGGSAAAMEGAMVQLTQAMSSGALRGEELNSILDVAPGIARNIEQYMGWASGSIKKYAEEGKISAEVVKNAMLASAESINEQFNSMPMTLSQAMTQVRNQVQHSLQGAAMDWNEFLNSDEGQKLLTQMINLFSLLAEMGVDALSAIGQGALWASQNLDFILPVLAAIGIAYAVLHRRAILTGLANIKNGLASAAAWSAAHWPIILLAVLLASALIAAQQFGFGMEEVGGFVGAVLGTLYAVGYNVFASLWNVIAAFAEFFANVWDDPLGATARLFFDIFDTILGIVETVAGAIDALLGTDMAGAVSGFRGKMAGWVDDTFGESAIQIKRMSDLDVAATAAQWGNMGSNIGSKLDNMNLSLDDIAGGIGGLGDFAVPTSGELGDIGDVKKVGSVKSVDGDVKLSDEDVKMYRDLAERRYMNNIELQTLAPVITVNVPKGSGDNISEDDLADKLKDILNKQRAAHTSVAHG